jgi:Xaa-Pro aminopeptidase
MKKTLYLLFVVSISGVLLSQDIFEFKQRRKILQGKLTDKDVVLLYSKPALKSSLYSPRYRQDPNFYYLSGYRKPDSMIVITTRFDGLITKSKVLTGEKKSEEIKKLKKETGFSMIRSYTESSNLLSAVLKDADMVYTNLTPVSMDKPLPENMFYINKLKERFPNLSFKNISVLVNGLRVIHSQSEIQLMRKAIEITDRAHLELMKTARPGIFEYHLEALSEYVYRSLGGMGFAFRSIIGSGKNGIELHYTRNTDELKAGDLIVMDIGAAYEMYCADITRTIPVSGRFSDRQKQFYNIVLKAQLAAIEAVKPGVAFWYPDQVSRKVLQEELEKIGFLKKGDTKSIWKYRKHSISHFLGLEVHDVGSWGAKLEPGMVITIEPGIYIPEYGFGIRIEDDVLVTDDGHEVLSHAPKTIKAIEKLMKKKGIGNVPISPIKELKN